MFSLCYAGFLWVLQCPLTVQKHAIRQKHVLACAVMAPVPQPYVACDRLQASCRMKVVDGWMVPSLP